VHRFLSLLSARRLLRDLEPERRRETLNQLLADAKKSWHGVKLNQPDWSDQSHSVAFSAEAPHGNLEFYLILNAYWEALDFELPQAGERTEEAWRRWIDTTQESPEDIVEWRNAPVLSGPTYRSGPRSVVVLFRYENASAPSS